MQAAAVTRKTVTGPVARFARQIAGQGYVCAAPSTYHEFTGPEPLNYDAKDTENGNEWKISKKLAAYDEDASLAVDYLVSLETCNGRVGATGMCLGGHLAYRCALDSRVKAAVCYFATDIHSRSLAAGKQDDSLLRAGDIKGELLMVSYPFFLMRSRVESELLTDRKDIRKKRYPRPSRRTRSHPSDLA